MQTPSNKALSNTLPTAWVLGPVPPPVTGMTLLTSAVLNALRDAGPVEFLDWSPGMHRRSWRMRLRRNMRILASLRKIITRGRVNREPIYLVANSGHGLYLTAMLVLASTRLGYTVYLHHHVYTYIDRRDSRMAWIAKHLEGRGVHVVHDQKMIDDFRARYSIKGDFITIFPSIIPIEIGRSRDKSHQPFRLGHLSNLSIDKGLREVIETFDLLQASENDVTLVIAGPPATANAERLLHETLAKHAHRVSHLGPVYGEDKARFFADIDVFLLPTHSESWGLVLNEALAAGVPVITYNRGCTATVVGDRAGLLIDPESPFAVHAVEQIKKWMFRNNEYLQSSQAAIQQAELLQNQGRRMLANFVDRIFSKYDCINPNSMRSETMLPTSAHRAASHG